jgi:hypothetical protein
MKTYVGIDPGKDGAIAILYPNGAIKTICTPKIGTEYDKGRMFSILTDIVQESEGRCHFVLENINGHVAQGRSTAFVMGIGKGLWEMALIAAKAPHTLVASQSWQKVAWQGVPPVKIPCKQNKSGVKTDSKATSLIAAKRLFPNVDLRKSARATTPHDGIVDALLMAEYARRTL